MKARLGFMLLTMGAMAGLRNCTAGDLDTMLAMDAAEQLGCEHAVQTGRRGSVEAGMISGMR